MDCLFDHKEIFRRWIAPEELYNIETVTNVFTYHAPLECRVVNSIYVFNIYNINTRIYIYTPTEVIERALRSPHHFRW